MARLDGLQRRERGQLQPRRAQAGQAVVETGDQGLDLGQFGHRSIVDPQRP